MTIKKLHRISGILLSTFILLHLYNHLLLLSSVEAHITFMKHFRSFYRHPIVEGFLISAAIAQIITGLTMVFTKQTQRVSTLGKIKRWSGIYLAFFLLVHLTAVFSARWVFHLDTNIYFAATGPVTHPYSYYFVPYYAISILAIFFHIAAIHASKMKKNILFLSPRLQSILIVLAGCAISFTIMYEIKKSFSSRNIPTANYRMFGGKAAVEKETLSK